jgi:hypothetical protein
MSFVNELGEALDTLWPLVQDQDDAVNRLVIEITNSKTISVVIELEDDDCLEGEIAWEQPVSDLTDQLSEGISYIARDHTDSIEYLQGDIQADVDRHKEARRKVKALDPSPLEELALQAE